MNARDAALSELSNGYLTLLSARMSPNFFSNAPWATSDLYSLRSPATDLACSQSTPIACRSSLSMSCHVFLGLPLLLFPPGVHCSAAPTGLDD